MYERRPGQPITFQTLYHELPQIDNEDPELVLDILLAGKRKCEERGLPLDMLHIIKGANWATRDPEYRKEFRLGRHDHLRLSLCEPGFEVLRWFPRYAERLGVDIQIARLLDYVQPSVLMGMSLVYWNNALRIIEAIPEVRDNLKERDQKPGLTLLDYGAERGLVALIDDHEESFVIKSAREAEEPIARKVSGIVGPRIIASSEDWIAEEFMHQKSPEQFLSQPEVVGAALGVALRKTHGLGISYNDRFRGHLKINPQTYRVSLIDWSNAKEDGEIRGDLGRAVHEIKSWYKEDLQAQVEALRAFAQRYRKA